MHKRLSEAPASQRLRCKHPQSGLYYPAHNSLQKKYRPPFLQKAGIKKILVFNYFSLFKNTTSIRPVLKPTTASQSAISTPSSVVLHEPLFPST